MEYTIDIPLKTLRTARTKKSLDRSIFNTSGFSHFQSPNSESVQPNFASKWKFKFSDTFGKWEWARMSISRSQTSLPNHYSPESERRGADEMIKENAEFIGEIKEKFGDHFDDITIIPSATLYLQILSIGIFGGRGSSPDTKRRMSSQCWRNCWSTVLRIPSRFLVFRQFGSGLVSISTEGKLEFKPSVMRPDALKWLADDSPCPTARILSFNI